MNDKMVSLLVITSDELLHEQFRHFTDCAKNAVSREITFEQRVEVLERMGSWGQRINDRISFLASRNANVERVDESIVKRVTDPNLQSRMRCGIFREDELRKLLDERRDVLPQELVTIAWRTLAHGPDSEYILFWQIGELEANGLLSNS